MSTITELKWQTLTRTVNEIAAPNRFLQRLLYSDDVVNLPTESIELGIVKAGREIAPFVRKNGEAIMVQGTQKQFTTVEAPNIRIKQPFTPSQLLFGREPGTQILLPVGTNQISAVRQHIARDIQHMENMVTNAIEYLVSLSLQGVMSYEVADEEVFTITIPRSAANNITLSTFWDDATPADTRPLQDIHAVKKIMSDIPGSEGLSPTDAICGTEAGDALLELVEVGAIKMLGQEGLEVAAGDMTFVTQFTSEGVIFLGRLGGVRFWQYGRTATLNSTSVDMIRPKYVEFISISRASERVLYYGAITDMHALEGRRIQSARFMKSWLQQDPSQMMALLHSRPLPWPRKPNATVSVKVVSG